MIVVTLTHCVLPRGVEAIRWPAKSSQGVASERATLTSMLRTCFNSHGDNADCWFGYYKEINGITEPVIDCEWMNGSPGLTVEYMENECTYIPPDMVGRGVELDWLRALWDVHTQGSQHATFTEMIEWMNAADRWSPTEAYQNLDEEASQIGGALETDWITAVDLNGIDH